MTRRFAALLMVLILLAGTLAALTPVDLLLVLASIGSFDAAAPPPPARSTMDADMQRGYDLRRDIEAAYARLRTAGPLQQNKDYDFTTLVAKYIPAGSSFDGTLSILRNAGLTVSRQNSDGQPPAPGRRQGASAYLALGGIFPCGHTLMVSLTSRAARDGTVTDAVRADIAVICL